MELGYGADRLGLGTLPSAIRTATTVDIGHSDLWLHTWSIRGLLIKENDPALKDMLGGFDVPAFTVGIHFKYNDSIGDISNKLPGAMTGIGYASDSGEDYTFTLTKTFGKGFFGKPLITTAGLRLSEAADLGFLGFGDTYHATFEGNVAILPWDKVLIAYEFRQKTDPYTLALGPLIGGEDNWKRHRRGPDSQPPFHVRCRLGPLREPGQCRGRQRLVRSDEVRVLEQERSAHHLRNNRCPDKES